VLGKNGENEMSLKKTYTCITLSKERKDALLKIGSTKLIKIAYSLDPNELVCVSSTMMFAKQLMQGGLTHYFLERGLSDFLISSARDIDAQYFGGLPGKEKDSSVWPFEADYLKSNVSEQGCVIYKGIALHFHKSEMKRSIMAIEADTPSGGMLYVSDFEDTFHTPVEDMSDNETEHILYKPDSEACHKIAKIVLGFSLYSRAFPDLIVPHAEECINFGKYIGKRYILKHGSESSTDISQSKSPHYRRGHFKLLTHERYKKKRGQVIFTKGTFVKGRAYDVITD
jgi:hypothetical protein